jgi:uncharacterized protein YjbI with pentapeptide repeats
LDFSRANLSGSDFRGANLAGAVLVQADLSDADLEGAILAGANLSEADIERCKGLDLGLGRAFTGIPLRYVFQGHSGKPWLVKIGG